MDERFRASLPAELTDEVQKFLKNPGCACNHPLYMSVMRKAKNQVVAYFPTLDTPPEEEIEKTFQKISTNDWQVINCHVDELTTELRKLKPGRKQLDIARWQDQVTIVINHLEDLF